ncbi:peptidoglycan DD-metalloendopeptidase family protein [Patescibacteria group bacterium]|nr:peptidoglycan DD-metalloendopeptidase family protein [Patescibacteria group bacterium]MBU1673590.1 peptidoglycan DD-metalloendopeptidase family protein [Patescibacteria group bacterium]MBU1964048.1 peptidoglycan DD-metalloendopeptidase family protein [Patescibacteria group bacterium]
MKKISLKQKYTLVSLFCAGVFVIGAFLVPLYAFAEKDMTPEKEEEQENISDLNDKIEEKSDVLNELQAKIKHYENNIEQKQQEAISLESQLDILEDDMDKNKTKIKKTKTELEKLEYEIGETRLQILDKEEKIDSKKIQLSGFLNSIYKNEQKTFLEILLVNESLSDFSSQLSYEEEIQKEFQGLLDDFQIEKIELNKAKSDLDKQKEVQKEKKSDLVAQQHMLEGEEEYTSTLLTEIEEDEEKFQELVKTMRAEKEDIDAEVDYIEGKLKKKIVTPGKTEDGEEISPFVDMDEFDPIWPCYGPITATFHDPTYPFRRWFEHDAVDIAVPQGTQLKAADSGYVAVARFDGSSRYAYILLVHADGYATLYGHVSAVYVDPEQYVSKGEVIALSGAMPGTPGAGSYTTGPHLHFGVRYNGIPVDPLQYLP